MEVSYNNSLETGGCSALMDIFLFRFFVGSAVFAVAGGKVLSALTGGSL